MEFIDKEVLNRIVRALQDDISVLQIKVGVLESLLLDDDARRAKYSQMVSEQAEGLIREQGNQPE